MEKENIYIGTLKFVNNKDMYKRYGESHVFGDYRCCGIEVGTLFTFVDVISEHAVLIKVGDDKYVLYNSMMDKLNTEFSTIDLLKSIITTEPNDDNGIYVDERTIVPYCEFKDEHKNAMQLKR